MWRNVLWASENSILHFGQILPMMISFLRENNPMIHLKKIPIKLFFLIHFDSGKTLRNSFYKKF